MFKVTINLSKNDVKKLSAFVGYDFECDSDAEMALQEFLTSSLLGEDVGESEDCADED